MEQWAIHSLLTFTVSIIDDLPVKKHTKHNQIVVFVLLWCFLVFLCACQHFAIQVKKHTLEFSYYFQVGVSHISHL